MKSRIVKVKNIFKLSEASQALLTRAPGTPGIGVIDGPAGYGKTKATTWLSMQVPCIHVRALALWTPSAMLCDMLAELRLPDGGSCAQMIRRLVNGLTPGHTIFIDEADYIARSTRLVETLRDLHDIALCPVILIGEEELLTKLAHLRRFTSRVAQHVTFEALDLDDTRVLARELCEVEIKPDLVERIHVTTGGNIRNIVVSLQNAEQRARARGKSAIGIEDIGHKPLFTGTAGSKRAPSPSPASPVNGAPNGPAAH